MTRKAAGCAALLACAVGCLTPSAVFATSLELYGFGPRATALAGTAEAAADDFYAAYANPANLALATHIHFGYGADVLWNRFAVDRSGGEAAYPSRLPGESWLGHVGISTPIGGWFANKAALGIAIHLPFSGPTRLDALDHRTPQLPMYDSLGDRLALVAGAAVRPVPWLSVGAALQLLTTLQGSARVDLGILDHRVTRKELEVELLTKPYPIVGVTVLPTEHLRLALVWRGESEVRYGLPLDVLLEDVGRLQFAVAGIGLYMPETYAFAASWRRGAWLLTGGAALSRWSGLPPLAPEVRLVLDDSELVEDGQVPDEILNIENRPIAVGARDIVQPRAAVEWQQNETLCWRAGLQYRPTPLPKADGPSAYLDAPATTAGLGLGIRFADPLAVARRPLQIDAAVGWTVLARRTVEKRDPQDPVGATSLHGDSLHFALSLHHDF